jgi:phosphate starvation-inducible PhoH-like protein
LNTPAHSVELALEPADNERLAELSGQFDAHLRQLEQRLGVEINSRGNRFRIIGEAGTVQLARQVLEGLYLETAQGSLTPEKVHLYLQEAGADRSGDAAAVSGETVVIKTPGSTITPRGVNQRHYLRNILHNDLNFGVGPAGTGKT